jgi:hypothetical protein
MDGFVRGGGSGNQGKIPKITEASNLLNAKAASSIKSAAQGVHQRAQRSQTLMRSAVKKPATLARTVNSGVKQADIRRAKRPQVDQARMARVQTIDKNTKVRRFGHGVHAPASARASAKGAEEGEVISRAPQSSNTKTSSSKSLIHKPLPSMVASASHQQLERMLDEALTRADAHKKGRLGRMPNQSLLQRIKAVPKWMSIGTAVAVAAIVALFVAVNKVPSVAVKVASAKAHVSAQLPGYTPAGFSFSGPVNYSDGKVSIRFKSNDSSNRQFTISQTDSKMSSKSLQDKVVPQDTQVQTAVVNGTTVYIYGQSNDAAWVNNGIQYVVKDGANLNSDQLLKIASSLN